MKRLSILLALLSSTALAEPVQTTLDGKWVYLAINESGSRFYIDSSRIAEVEGKAGSRRFWLLIDSESKQIKTEVELSCRDNDLRTGAEYQYKKSGALLSKIEEWDEQPTPIGEGTVFEVVRNWVCNP